MARPPPVSDRDGVSGGGRHRLLNSSGAGAECSEGRLCHASAASLARVGLDRGAEGQWCHQPQSGSEAAVPRVRDGVVARRGGGRAGVEEEECGGAAVASPPRGRWGPGGGRAGPSALPRGSALASLAAAVAGRGLRPHLCERSAAGLGRSENRRGEHLRGAHVSRSGEHGPRPRTPPFPRGNSAVRSCLSGFFHMRNCVAVSSGISACC